jgi:transcriptional regulator with XRE-family HTH domain
MGIGLRLREVREELGLTQPAMAALAGLKKQAQLRYESDERRPDADYLAAIAAAGADVLYILTGQRNQPISPKAALPREQQALLNSYEMCSATARKNLLQTAALLASGAQSTQGGVSVRVSGVGNVAAGRDAGAKRTK